MTLALGDIRDHRGTPVKVVGFRKKVRGPIQDNPATYAVFVEQAGQYRMGTVRATALEGQGES